MIYEGNAWKLGDNVDTDVIIPARYLTTPDAETLTAHCLEDVYPGFDKRVTKGDMLVAGRNFGCGSSREHAPLVLKAAGISAVIAESFARIFYRNAFNVGLPVLQSPAAAKAIQQGDRVGVDLRAGRIHNETRDENYQFTPIAEFMLELIAHDGLMKHLIKGGWK
jgi:3-isopropylmalate/(R)-2-methylmalate dehydratase small subunit